MKRAVCDMPQGVEVKAVWKNFRRPFEWFDYLPLLSALAFFQRSVQLRVAVFFSKDATAKSSRFTLAKSTRSMCTKRSNSRTGLGILQAGFVTGTTD